MTTQTDEMPHVAALARFPEGMDAEQRRACLQGYLAAWLTLAWDLDEYAAAWAAAGGDPAAAAVDRAVAAMQGAGLQADIIPVALANWIDTTEEETAESLMRFVADLLRDDPRDLPPRDSRESRAADPEGDAEPEPEPEPDDGADGPPPPVDGPEPEPATEPGPAVAAAGDPTALVGRDVRVVQPDDPTAPPLGRVTAVFDNGTARVQWENGTATDGVDPATLKPVAPGVAATLAAFQDPAPAEVEAEEVRLPVPAHKAHKLRTWFDPAHPAKTAAYAAGQPLPGYTFEAVRGDLRIAARICSGGPEAPVYVDLVAYDGQNDLVGTASPAGTLDAPRLLDAAGRRFRVVLDLPEQG